jgi:hypothetical protein
MTGNTVSEIERMVVTRIFDAPRELVWKAWTDPKYVMQWWGPKGFTAPVCQMDFRVGGKSLLCMRTPDGQEFWNAVEYHEIVLHTQERTDASQREEQAYLNPNSNEHMEEQHDLHTQADRILSVR